VSPVKAITLEFEEAGFELLRQNNHLVWRCPCGHRKVTSSGSHCKGRADENAKALIKRTLKQCQERIAR
jgi:hypothetical protein